MRFAILMAVGLGFGCAASGAADPPPPSPADEHVDSVASYCQARAQAECSDTVVAKCAVVDAKSCASARSSECVRTAPQGTELVTAQAPACLRIVTAAYADAVLTADEMKQMDDACGAQLFSGPGAARAPCSGPYDCRSIDGLTCLIPTEQTEGKCMKLEPVPANGACPGEADECPTDYFCDPKAKICLPAADLGDVCDPINHPCKTGMTCPGGPFVVTCTGKWDQGHACRADTDCASNICARQPDSADGNCADEITLSPLDATCAQFKGPVTGQ